MSDQLAFAKLLNERRIESGLSYHQLAERACVDSAYIYALANGKKRSPSRDVVILLGNALGLDNQGLDEFVTTAGHLPLIRQRRSLRPMS